MLEAADKSMQKRGEAVELEGSRESL
jgi:hypothetical protein